MPNSDSNSSSLLNRVGVGLFMRLMVPATVGYAAFCDPLGGLLLGVGMSTLSLASHPRPRASRFLSVRVHPKRLAHPLWPIAATAVLGLAAHNVASMPAEEIAASSAQPIVSASAH